MTNDPILIVGAGPTGLVLALQLARRGVPLRIIDKSPEAGRASRAMGVHARTLEFYRQLGIAEGLVDEGIVAQVVHIRRGRQKVASVNLGNMGQGLSPYPFLLTYPQDAHEKFLEERLIDCGVVVERDTTLQHFTQNAGGVRGQLVRRGESIAVRASYLCGRDGAHSFVRRGLDIAFTGTTYDALLYVADVTVQPGNDDICVSLAAASMVLMMPVGRPGVQRLIGLVPAQLVAKRDLSFADLLPTVERLLDIKVATVNWFAPYHVHHRVAKAFQHGRVFLLGDAAHIHSPVGGQGMNTGIGDATNLGWKLADVERDRAPETLLDTYEPERMAFARKLVSTTDAMFRRMLGRGGHNPIFRTAILPRLASILAHFDWPRHALFSLVSQIGIDYRHSALSAGSAGAQGGDRLPWVQNKPGQDNFAPLTSLDWQLHVYGEARAELAAMSEELNIPLHVMVWTGAARRAGLKQDAMYLVRPDGYIALANMSQDCAILRRYWDKNRSHQARML